MVNMKQEKRREKRMSKRWNKKRVTAFRALKSRLGKKQQLLVWPIVKLLSCQFSKRWMRVIEKSKMGERNCKTVVTEVTKLADWLGLFVKQKSSLLSGERKRRWSAQLRGFGTVGTWKRKWKKRKSKAKSVPKRLYSTRIIIIWLGSFALLPKGTFVPNSVCEYVCSG